MFNSDDIGRPICKIVGGTDNNEVISLDTEASNININDKKKGLKGKKKIDYFESLELDKPAIFQQLPNTKTEREVGMITGQSGSGKSYYANKYIAEYKKAFKKNPIYFFSVLEDDTSINDKLVKRIKLNESWIDEALILEDVKDSLCVFDDIEMIKDERIFKQVFKFINEILTTGRHTNTSCILTIHQANKPYIRDFLTEVHWYVYFPRGSNSRINYVLENYIGIDKKEIKYIKNLETRWACIFRQYPNCVMTERNLFMLSNLD
jgi:nucleoside-triphosphatase THEP1